MTGDVLELLCAPQTLNYALMRLPDEPEATLFIQSGKIRSCDSLASLNGQRGFVIAPFHADPHCPILLLQPDKSLRFQPLDGDVPAISGMREDRRQYAATFASVVEEMRKQSINKVVLSRKAHIEKRTSRDQTTVGAKTSAFHLFCRACVTYPDQYIALINTPASGMWLTISPELLIKGQQQHWRTVALAGTVTLAEDGRRQAGWGEEKREEQALVARYLLETLTPLAHSVEQTPLDEIRAGKLKHLCTHFHFTKHEDVGVGDLLEALHPTPAVCGYPKADALRVIRSLEVESRAYYAGFTGLLTPEATTLFVTLRCMKLDDDAYTLFAGGGLLPDSDEEVEWEETANKLQTIYSLFR